MPFLTQDKTNWKFIAILVILAIIVGGGIFYYFLKFPEVKFPPIKFPPKPEKEVTLTTDKTEYEVGETIKIVIKNGLDKSIWYPSSPYVRNLELLGYDEKTKWGLVPLLPPSPPPPEGRPLEIKELRKDEVLTLEYRPLDWHHSIALNFIKYKFSFEYRENKEEGEYKKIYSNEFTIKEKIVEITDWKTYRSEGYGFEIKYPEDILFVPEQVMRGPVLRSFSTTSIEESPVPDLSVYLDNIKVSPHEDAQNKLKNLPVYLEGSGPYEEKIGGFTIYVILIKLYGGAEGVTRSYYFPKFILSFSFANNIIENKFKNLERQILSTFQFLE